MLSHHSQQQYWGYDLGILIPFVVIQMTCWFPMAVYLKEIPQKKHYCNQIWTLIVAFPILPQLSSMYREVETLH